LGKRYTEDEISLIQELAGEGHTDEAIANRLGRSTDRKPDTEATSKQEKPKTSNNSKRKDMNSFNKQRN